MQDKIKRFLAERLAGKLDKLEKEATKAKADRPDEAHAIAADFLQKKAELADAHQPAVWLTDAAARAGQIAFVTHGAKFTHSDAKASNVYAPQRDASGWVCTATLAEITPDVAGNAAALDVAALLRLEVDGTTLAALLEAGDTSALAAFAQDPAQLAQWQEGFAKVFITKDLRSHTLMRQVFFPLGDGQYHQLGPMFSSALAHSLYQRISLQRFGEAAKENRKLRREDKHSTVPVIDFPNLAAIKFGGTKPQNISMGNSQRGGRAWLLACLPPVWREQKLPNFNTSDAFWYAWERYDGYFARNTARELKKYLISVKDQASTMTIRAFRREMVDELIDSLLTYAMAIQAMEDLAGWSKHSALPRVEQLWLDPHRAATDEAFQTEHEAGEWREAITRRFGQWLNEKLRSEKLRGDELPVGDPEFNEWQRELKRASARLRAELRYDDMREVV